MRITRILSALLILFTSVSSVLLYSRPAGASSIYDSYYQKSDAIKVNANNYYGRTCSDVDISANWSSYILDKSKWLNETYNGNADVSLQNAFDHGRWAVSMSNQWGQNGYFTIVTVAWTEDTSLAVQWNPTDERVEVVGNQLHAISISSRFIVSGIAGDCDPIAWSYGATGIPFVVMSSKKPFVNSPASSNEAGATTNLFIYSDHYNYPTGYAGPQIPGSHNQKSDFYVPYILNVDDKNITVTPKPVDTGGKCWRWASTLVKKGSSTSENFADWEVIAETDYLESNAPAQLRAREYGNDYAIGMMAYDCNAPAVKISDFYNLKLERIFPLKIDGSSYILDSANLNCENQGLCEELTPYEDCASYGVDLIGGLGCVMRNFGVFLRSLFITLFVPSPGFFKDYFTDFKTFIDTKFGFLIWPLTFAIDFVNAFFNGVNGTNNICNWSFGNLFNSDFKLNFCSLEQNFPSAFNTARYMIQAFTVFVLISGLYTHYRRLLTT